MSDKRTEKVSPSGIGSARRKVAMPSTGTARQSSFTRSPPGSVSRSAENSERLVALEGKMDSIVGMMTDLMAAVATMKHGSNSKAVDGYDGNVYEEHHKKAAVRTQNWWRKKMAREQEKLDELDRRQLAVDQRLKSASRHESRRTAMEIATGVTKPIGGSGGGGGGGFSGFGGGGGGGGGGSEGVVGGSATFQKRRQSDGDSRTRKPSTPLGKLSDTMRAGSRTFFAPSFSHSPAKSDGRVTNDELESVTELDAQLDPVVQVRRSDDTCMINPRNRFRMCWDICLVMPLLLYLLVVMPFRLCFMNEAQKFSPIYWFEFMVDMIFIIDIFLNFRTGYFVGTAEDDLVEFDPYLIARNYVRGWFFLDVVSGIPFALLDLVFSSSGNVKILKTAKSLRLLRFLKLGRLLKIEKILSNLDRDTLDHIEDFLQNGSTRSGLLMISLALKTGFICHLLACFWVLVGRIGSAKDMDNWMLYEIKGKFDKSDTTGGDNVGSIYLAAFYFCLTTMTSVGYGDILPYNNTERAFCVLLEFVGAIVFGLTVASLTSVVTSIDINARKTAEQLDAVSSFVAQRNFPEVLGRRIRRHFRHFYSMKSAIDEAKIFSELSTTLRGEVSSYLLTELMADMSLFHSMNPVLWPKLLVLLRPMRFEMAELVCAQSEACTEMYVVLNGVMQGETVLSKSTTKRLFGERATRGNRLLLGGGDEAAKGATTEDRGNDLALSKISRELLQDDSFNEASEEHGHMRRIVTGDSVNILCALGVWNRCIETVIAQSPVSECYSINQKDFKSLFLSSEDDKKAFEEMQAKEVRNFRMLKDVKAPTPYGRPLYFTCFSSLRLCVVQGRNIGGYDIKTRDLNPFAVADIVKISATGSLDEVETLGKIWSHRVHTARQTRDPFWDSVIHWSDIKLPFTKLALRVRVFDSDLLGKESFLGQFTVSLLELERGSSRLVESLSPVTEGEGDVLGGDWGFLSHKAGSGNANDAKKARRRATDSSSDANRKCEQRRDGSPLGKKLGPFSDGRHEAWYDLLAPKGLPAKGAAGITGSVQIWAQTRRSESELKQQDQKNKRSGTRKANNYIAVAQKAQRSTM